MKQESRTNINRVKKDISSPDSFTPPEELKRQLITTMQSIYDEEDIEAVERAYKVAYKAHEKQKRKSGEPYIIHPICVAIILAELELDKETIMAGLLHDVVEDTETTHEDIVRDFGEEVAQLVDGVTKLGQLSYSKDKIEVQAENLRKMFLAMAKDIRVILIKLADRLHNMRTMQFMRPEKQKEKSRETMDIYAPIAHRLGISKIKVELDDLALRYLKPDVYEDLERSLDSAKEEREAFIQEIVDEVKGHIDHAGIKAEIDGRVKHMFSIYKKMVNQHKTIDQIYDLFAVRIKVDTVKDCYAALGIIHEMYKPIPGRFKDYIAMPKPNMYQSLHTTLIGPEGHPFEIQIRTFEMHRVAEYGIAAHWKYKENNNTKGLNKEEEKLSWLREVLEWQRDMDDNKEFLSLLKTNLDLFAEQVYCFTPNGDVKNLANGSTPIDFAYSIHSAVGNKMVGARVNGRQVPFDYHLQNGDRIYKKMVNQHKTIDQIYDLFAVRIKVDTVKDCYAALGIIHEMYKPIPGRFKDYIAMPKPNMYQSLHTTLIGPEGHPFEIQIRTFEMHRVAEYGIAAHWKYKENNNTKGLNKEEEKLSWLREVLEWQRDMDDNKEFLSLLKTNLDLFAEQVYCFTPNGDVKNLANGSTPIDFAYSIHSAVGNKMVGARVNGRQVPFDYHLQNGDRVEIITSQNSKGPSRDWLGIVKSAQARSKINQWFKRQFKEENIIRGKELLEKYCKSKSIRLPELMKPEYIKKVELKYGFKDWDSVCAAVGHGGLKEGQVINKMQEEDRKIQKQKITDEQILQKTTEAAQAAAANPEKKKEEKSKGGIVVRGANDVAVRFSKCCNPVPGDEIVGFITRGRGISIHRTDCVNLLNMPESDRARLIEAEWQVSEADTTQTYMTEINIYANNRKGLLAEVSKIFLELDIDIITINVSNNKKGRATLSMSFDITGVEQLNRIIAKIRNVEGVIDIERTAG